MVKIDSRLYYKPSTMLHHIIMRGVYRSTVKPLKRGPDLRPNQPGPYEGWLNGL